MRTPETSTEITPLSRLFTYHIFGEPVELGRWVRDPTTYRLRVGGLVERSLELSVEELARGYPSVTREVILQCMTNIHWGRIRVRGVPIARVLEKAGVVAGARKIVIRGADGFTSDLHLEDVLESPEQFLLAFEMNGEKVPPEHGFPVRVVSDGRYGYKWCKWVTSLEATDRDAKGHYEGRRGWSDVGTRGVPPA